MHQPKRNNDTFKSDAFVVSKQSYKADIMRGMNIIDFVSVLAHSFASTNKGAKYASRHN
jgi:hypothetical protein